MNTATHLFNKVVLMATDNTRPDPESGIHNVPIWIPVMVGVSFIVAMCLISIINWIGSRNEKMKEDKYKKVKNTEEVSLTKVINMAFNPSKDKTRLHEIKDGGIKEENNQNIERTDGDTKYLW